METQFDPLLQVRLLHSFCTVVQTLSMTAAAERIGLSQPAVSQHIQTLERGLGEILFERKGPRLILTPAGETLYALALPLIEALSHLGEDYAAELGRTEGGILRIAAGGSTLLYLLPRYVERFSRLNPEVDIRLDNVTGRDGQGMLRRDEVDFAVGPLLDVPDDLRYRTLFEFSHVLITPTGHPLTRAKQITPELIAAYPLITPPHGGVTAEMIDSMFRKQNTGYKVILETGGWDVIKRYVASGIGCAIVSGICLGPEDVLPAFGLDEWLPSRTYGIVTRAGKFFSPAARLFIESLKPEPIALPWLKHA